MQQGRRRDDSASHADARTGGALNSDAQQRLGTRLLSVVLCVMISASAIGVLIDGRNLDALDFLTDVDADGPGAWLLRMSTLFVIAGSLCVIALSLRPRGGPSQTAWFVIGGYVVFFVTNTIINGIMGTAPALVPKSIYPLIVLGAVFVQRDAHAQLFDVVKVTLAAVLVVSLCLAPMLPEVMMRSYAPELRLPVVTFRFWGLGNSPNSTGPLALALLLMCLHRPFRPVALQVLVVPAAFTILVLAQSQTAWVTALLIVPLYLMFRLLVPPGAYAPDAGGYGWLTICFAVVAAAGFFVLPEAAGAIDDTSMTGRGRIWRTALDLFRDNPLFGYGPTAWDTAFRISIGMPFAYTAHNQALQSLSTAGLVGFIGWCVYLSALVIAGARLARPTRGLAPALLISFPFIRSFSEASFDFKIITADEFILHVIVFIVMTGSWYRHEPGEAERPGFDAAFDDAGPAQRGLRGFVYK